MNHSCFYVYFFFAFESQVKKWKRRNRKENVEVNLYFWINLRSDWIELCSILLLTEADAEHDIQLDHEPKMIPVIVRNNL